ncbi:flagellar biosynthetic protein FliO [Paenibacillus pini]|uniref:Flagellar biosynthesis protein FliZ n=1 Tax=Paenibacillus pini JCM 16418 TaxID=1236976 RepID=W7YQH0_9BACL|nr:flagellar biosynthetic protein FliO [Paenibacillus pini]GAF09698.1 flagellar biosynthesis protein FliZ [Paenibacillus pini JCM 16418]
MSTPDTSLPSTGSNALYLMYVIFVLIIIVGLIIILIRFLGRKNKTWFSNRSVRTLGTVGLGPNKSLQIIEIGNKIYLVGVGEDIRLVDKISDPDEVALILASFEQESANQVGSLSPFIANMISKLRKQKVVSEDIELEDTSSFHEVFDDKLRRMSSRKEKMKEILRDDNTTDRLRDP